MDYLPNEILEKIFFHKHQLEMEDVFDDLIDTYESKLYNIYALILYFKSNVMTCPSCYHDIADLYIVLRNTSQISNDELLSELNRLNNNILFSNGFLDDEYPEELLDIDCLMKNDTLSVNTVLSIFDSFICDALVHKQNYDNWIEVNVDRNL